MGSGIGGNVCAYEVGEKKVEETLHDDLLVKEFGMGYGIALF